MDILITRTVTRKKGGWWRTRKIVSYNVKVMEYGRVWIDAPLNSLCALEVFNGNPDAFHLRLAGRTDGTVAIVQGRRL